MLGTREPRATTTRTLPVGPLFSNHHTRGQYRASHTTPACTHAVPGMHIVGASSTRHCIECAQATSSGAHLRGGEA
eukprot:1750134-Rhodomonas_salina.1